MKFLGRQAHLQGTNIFLEILDLRRAGNGEDIITLSQQPCQRQLARRDALLLSNFAEGIDDLEVEREVLLAEAWCPSAEVILGEVVWRLDTAREEASAEGRVGDDSSAEFAGRLE